MDCHFNLNKRLSIWMLSLGILSVLLNNTTANESQIPFGVNVLQFDSIIELNAPLCRTHVVLFARYWVSPELYRMAVVWAEPHAGSLNFPIFPRSLNVASDPEVFRIEHQFQHMYDGVYPRPIGQRGPFRHQFNSYYFSDVRFAEQDALDMRIYSKDIEPLKKTGIYDINIPGTSDSFRQKPARLSVRATNDRLVELGIFDIEGKLLKSIKYEYKEQKDGGQLHKQIVHLPERPIAVGFKGEGPTITIGGEKQQISQLETTHHQGGRKCVVDYQPIEIDGHTKTLPCRITVYSGDSNSILRSAKLYNFTRCQISTDQLEEDAKRFSFLDGNETICREMLLKYWLKDPVEVEQADVKTLERLRAHFADKSTAGMTAGEQLRRVNILLQLDWMLGYMPQLERNFLEYLSLLTKNDLDRMILVGGQNAIEMTSRWGRLDTADSMLETWMDVAVSQNDVESVLDFAADSVRKKRFWTIVKLMDKVLEEPQLSASQQFVGKALRCIGLARLCEMLDNPDRIKTELDIAQARWVSSQVGTESIRRDLTQSMFAAKQLFDSLDKPTRQHKVLRAQLEKVNPETQNAEVNDPNDFQ
jgi:hypothetical protein